MLFHSIFKMSTISSFLYLDPGSGSFILQVLIASFVGIGFALRRYWSKITNLFRKDSEEVDFDDADNE